MSHGQPTSRSALVGDLGPDAGWATVCFGTPRPVGRAVVWRAGGVRGLVVVRSDALRFPAAGHPYPCPHPPGRLPCDVHLWADADARGAPDLREQADVLVSRVPLPGPAAHRRVRELLSRHPGCLAVAVPGPGTGCAVGVRDAARGVRCAGLGRQSEAGVPVPARVVASVVHAWVVAGGSVGALSAIAALPPG
ncbi:hypothetical protein [Streptomyces sp. NPDC057877]|uniref:hypothetical protein n=1 Tax=Streptomyces sp. NPDC057877 TaxID=3346269 RepID=UPI00369A9420